MDGLTMRILGVPALAIDGRALAATGRVAALIVRLALANGSPLAAPTLRTDLWPDEPASDGAVRVTLTRARGLLGAEAIQRSPAGYTLVGADLDAQRFERLLASARDRGRTLDERATSYESALALWTGRALEGYDAYSWAQLAARRLDDLRELATDERIELMLVRGAHEVVLPDLRRVFEADPLQEHRARLYATALYRSGRQADALAVLDRTRRALRDDLGLAVSAATADLEHRILRHDPVLAVAPAARVNASSVDVEARLRSATALLRAGIVEEAASIIGEAERVAIDAGDRRSQGEALLCRSRLAMVRGEDPHPFIDEARRIGREIRSGELLAAAALTRFSAGVPSNKVDVMVELTEPLELLSPNARERIDLLCATAVVVAFIDASIAADRLVEEAERTHERIGSTSSHAVLLVSRSLVRAVRRDPDASMGADAQLAYDLARSAEDPRLIVIATQALLRHLYTEGRLDDVDRLLAPLEEASRASFLSFGLVRAHLCRASNAIARGELDAVPGHVTAAAELGARLRTFASAGAVRTQQLLLALELDQHDVIRGVAGPMRAAARHPVWTAVLAVAGDEAAAEQLAHEITDVRHDDSYWVLLALAALVAAERGDEVVGRWSAERLEPFGDTTIVVGLGSLVMGFASHFAGAARLATGEVDLAIEHFERAGELAGRRGAHLWQAHSDVELARVLATTSVDVDRAHRILATWRSSDVARQSIRLRRRLDEATRVIGVAGAAGH